MKTVLYTPGIGEERTDRRHSGLFTVFRNAGYDPQYVSIDWKDTMPDQWVRQLDDAYSHYQSFNTVLAAFSMSGLTTAISAAKRPPSEVWLFSLSPFFGAEDILPDPAVQAVEWYTQPRVDEFKKLSFSVLAKHIDCPVKLFVGTEEMETVRNRAETANRDLARSTLTWVNGAGHDISQPAYLEAIAARIQVTA